MTVILDLDWLVIFRECVKQMVCGMEQFPCVNVSIDNDIVKCLKGIADRDQNVGKFVKKHGLSYRIVVTC